ncbi:MAG: leucine-rich repeat domain-containing protein, partial [Oscillospiraceae bacterium]|nr:leucine-rich repeat domain-containing protein [Oscillospiraceae bacterium]
LASITIPNSVTSIGYCAFSNTAYYNNESNWSDNVLYIGNHLIAAKNNVSGLYEIKPGTITISGSAFYRCTRLTSITIPDSVTSIGDGTFSGCTSLTSITIGNGVTSIREDVFSCCESLTSITIPNSVTSIGSGAFNSCDSLTSITIGNGVTSIESWAFSSCKNLKDVYYNGSEEDWKKIDIADYNTNLTNATIHFISSIPDNPQPDEPLPEINRTISLSFTGGDNIRYDADAEIYNTNSFPFTLLFDNLFISGDFDREDASAHNVKANVTLPNGFSFEQNADVKKKSYAFDEIEWTVFISETIYLRNPPVGLSQIRAHVTGDNVNTADFTYNIVIDRYAFDVDIYRADFLTTSSLGRTMEDTYFNLSESPSQRLRAAGRECGMDGAAGAWNAFMDTLKMIDNPSSIVDYAFEEKDMYEAIIMSLFESSVDYKVMSCINNDITKQTRNFVSEVTSQMETIFEYQGFSTIDLKKLSKEEKDNLFKNCDAAFKKAHPDAAAIGDITSFIGKAIDYASDFQSLCEQINAYYNIRLLSDSMKQIMTDMYNSCPSDNPALKQALRDCIGVMNTSDDEFTQRMVANLIGLTGKNVAEAGIKEFWKGAKQSFQMAHPAAFVFQSAYDAGKYVTQVCYNSDKIQEKYCKIIALVNTENLLYTVYNDSKNRFMSNKTKENAQSYNSAVDIMFNMLDNDCKYATAFADALDSSLVGQITNALGDTTTEDFKKSVSSIRSSTDIFHETVLTYWIGELESEGNDRYKEYEYLLDESWERMKKRYNIACPVDVYIYDKNGVIVGSVVDNVPYCRPDANITIAVEGDKKTVYMYGEEEYKISYIGNDIGAMDINIAEYDDEGNITRNVYFNNIELVDGLTYTSNDSGESSVKDAYVLTDENDTDVIPEYDTINNSDSVTYSANVERGYFTEQASVSHELHAGENAKITAYIPEGYKFIGWVTNTGENIFADETSISTTICMPAHDITIIAVIEVDDDFINLNLTLSNPNDFDVSAVVFFAIYDDDDNFIKVSSTDVLMPPGKSTHKCSIDTKGIPIGTYTAKVFVWRDREGLRPISLPTNLRVEIY